MGYRRGWVSRMNLGLRPCTVPGPYWMTPRMSQALPTAGARTDPLKGLGYTARHTPREKTGYAGRCGESPRCQRGCAAQG